MKNTSRIAGLCLLMSQAACVIITDSDSGSFEVNWSVTIDGVAATCAEAGAVDVAIAVEGYSEEIFPCSAGVAETLEVDPGFYDISVELLDIDGNSLSGPVIFQDREIAFDGDLIVLEDIIWALESPGFNILYTTAFSSGPSSVSNCAPLDSGGEEVDSEIVSLVFNTSNMCERYVLVGEAPAGDLLGETCMTGIGCLEANILRVIEAVPNGTYTMTIEGISDLGGAQGLTTCFALDILNVTINGSDIDLGEQTVPRLMTRLLGSCNHFSFPSHIQGAQLRPPLLISALRAQ